MRTGADRIIKCIMGIFNGYGLPEVMPWRTIAEQLGNDRGCILEAPPYVFKCDVGRPKLLVSTQPLTLKILARDTGVSRILIPRNISF